MPTFELAFRAGVTTQINIDERNFLFYAAHRKIAPVPDPTQMIRDALDQPIGTPRLRNLLKRDQRVVIMIDDITRPTPTADILPPIVRAIQDAGIPDSAVKIFAAMGTQRPMTEDELRVKLGAYYGRFRVVNRDYRYADFVSLGKTPSGTPVEVDRELLDADFRIAIGNVIPHISAGWGGGSKMILPGACSHNTVNMLHLMACIVQPVLEVLGTRDNRTRAEMDAVAAQVGLDFLVNTVLDEDKRILGIFAGHFIEAHRQATELAEKLMVIPIPRPADILIVSANPCHFDYWQGIKPYTYAHRAVREGGVMIFLLDGAEHLCGDAPSHEETVRQYLPWSFEDQKAAVERGEIEDLVGLNVPMYHASVRHRVAKTICVTNHLDARDLDALQFDSAPSVPAALEEAYKILGRDAMVGVIPFGGETLTRVAPEEI
jgi:nickel-dependent lactate racemase